MTQRIAFQGEPGAYSHEACRKARPDLTPLPCRTFEDVIEAVQSGRYECFVREDTCLPMMYMPDAIKATLQIMAAPRERLTRRGDYNLGAMSFTVGEQAASIRELVPDFTVSYVPDYRQAIAESWPRSVDDRAARADWDWTPDFDLDAMTRDMIAALRRKQAAGALEG